jgi:hypothetical protein
MGWGINKDSITAECRDLISRQSLIQEYPRRWHYTGSIGEFFYSIACK